MKKELLCVMMLLICHTHAINSQILSSPNNSLVFNCDYYFDKIYNIEDPYYRSFCEQHFFLSSTFKNKYRLRLLFGLPYDVLFENRDIQWNTTWGIGTEFILNKNGKRFYFSFGPEYIRNRKYREGGYLGINSITLITKFSFRINPSITIICEPANIGFGNFSHINYVSNLPSLFNKGIVFQRMLSLGISIKI